MKQILTLLFSLIFSTSVAHAIVTFEHLFQHPNSYYFDTCSPPNQCGGSYLQEYPMSRILNRIPIQQSHISQKIHQTTTDYLCSD